jgi:hypothetical protein
MLRNVGELAANNIEGLKEDGQPVPTPSSTIEFVYMAA